MSTHFGNSGNDNVFTVAFPFREYGIMVDFHVNLSGKVTGVDIGRPYDRRVEVSEIGEYGKLLQAIDTHIRVMEMEFSRK